MTGPIEELVPAEYQAIRLSPCDAESGVWYGRIGRMHLVQLRTDQAIVWLEKSAQRRTCRG